MALLQDSMQQQGAAPMQGAADAEPDQAADQGAGQTLPAPRPGIQCPTVQKHMPQVEQMVKAMLPDMQQKLQRLVQAGKNVMYSADTADMVKHLVFDDDIPMPNKLGEGIANLLVMMDNQTNGSIPKDLMVPAGVILLMEAADYLFEVGLPITDEDLSKGMELMVYGIFRGFGIPEDKVDEVVGKLADQLGLKDSDIQSGAPAAEPSADQAAQDEEAGFQQGFQQQQQQGV